MPVWFIALLLVVLGIAILLAIAMAASRRSGGQYTSDGQNTTIIERRPDENTTVVED